MTTIPPTPPGQREPTQGLTLRAIAAIHRIVAAREFADSDRAEEKWAALLTLVRYALSEEEMTCYEQAIRILDPREDA